MRRTLPISARRMYLRTKAKAPLPQTLGLLPDGPASAPATLALMRQMIRTGRKNPFVRVQAESLITGLPHKAYGQQARECFHFVRDDVQYVRDPRDVERIQTPEALLQSRKGDCDDKVVLLCSLLESIGHPTRLVVIGLHGGPFSHVYCETRIGAHWVPCETTEPWPMGVAAHQGVTSAYRREI